ncbi:12418_t:CDS:2 [Acaulospora colombiana]|uniref:12418_t:CDS:1 n=1 Tax=Acaulospora colombiana TaxID=27376 RepID=A0ACA9N5X5_9GLOM|nr:12418_t:CDS:2 [Acaulospora colombiana]
MSLSPASSMTSSDADSVYHEEDVLTCLWKKCNRQFDDAETMYTHLSTDHVGRKSTGNLCLDCYWDDCDVRTSKRDHITSHLRVHVPLKPHICENLKGKKLLLIIDMQESIQTSTGLEETLQNS